MNNQSGSLGERSMKWLLTNAPIYWRRYWQWAKANSKRARNLWLMILATSCCCYTFVAAGIYSTTPEYKATRTVRAKETETFGMTATALLFTPTHTNSPTVTWTPSATWTPTRTNTPTQTWTPTITLTPTITWTPSNTPTKTAIATNTKIPTKTTAPTNTRMPTATTGPVVVVPPGGGTGGGSGSGGTGNAGCDCARDYNCSDFTTHAAAQSCYVSCGGNNWSGLDRDNDGNACESLP